MMLLVTKEMDGMKMKRNEFFNMVEGLFNFFRYSNSPATQTINDWHKNLEYIDVKAIPYIKNQIEDLDSLPRNLPKTIKGAYEGYKRQNKGSVFVKYDEYDDIRYPMANLYRAAEIYIAKGHSAFSYYCKTNYMPSQDVERVKSKVEILIDRGLIKEIVDNVGINVSDFQPGREKEAIREKSRREAQNRLEGF